MLDLAPCKPHYRCTRFYKKSKNKKLLLDYQDLFKSMALYVQCFQYAFVQEIAAILKHGLDSSVDTS